MNAWIVIVEEPSGKQVAMKVPGESIYDALSQCQNKYTDMTEGRSMEHTWITTIVRVSE